MCILGLTLLVTVLWAGKSDSLCYIDTTGKVVIADQFESPEGGFHSGRALVMLAGGTRAFIDRRGKPVFPVKYAYGHPHDFHEGLVWIQPDQFLHCVDSMGRSAFPDSFYDAGDFHEGLCAVNTRYSRNGESLGCWGFIDRSGNMVIPAQFTEAAGYSQGFSEGLAAVAVGGACVKEREWQTTGRHWGFIDRTGKMVIEARYDFVRDFHDGRAVVNSGTDCALINRAGERVNASTVAAGDFSEGLCAIMDSSGKYGYIDTLGQTVIAAQYRWALPFSEGRALVQLRDRGKCGFIDRSGESVTPFIYEEAKALFHDGRARVVIRQTNGSTRDGFIDRQGKMVIPAIYLAADGFSEGLAIVLIPN